MSARSYTLKHPVELKNSSGDVVETISALELKRFNGADIRAIANAKSKGEGEMLATMICRSATIPPSTFDKLDGEDVTEVGGIVAGFMGSALPTGAL